MRNPAHRSLMAGTRVHRSGPGATRTRDLLLRRQALYPTELRTLGFGSGKLASRDVIRNRRRLGSHTGSPSIPSGISTLSLVVKEGGDGNAFDHADWGDARLSCG